MSLPATALACAGCGRPVDVGTALPFHCAGARAGDGIDHVIARSGPPPGVAWPDEGEPNPFLRFRALLYSWQVALARGMADADYIALVRDLDAAVAEVDGAGFATTPYVPAPALAEELGLGGLWVKDETGNVAGSHKARHLMGLAIYLAVAERTGLLTDADANRPLAIASCGNAALAAAVIARAAGRPLRVFIPTWADRPVVERLEALGAELVVCERRDDDPPGDPCVLRFRAAVDRGALPFSCQGPDNGLTIDGGMTLAWELIDQHDGDPLDRLVIQVGGGALASACVQALRWAHELEVLERLPAIHAVQPASSHPLVRAWRWLIDGAAARQRGSAATPIAVGGDRARAHWQRDNAGASELELELRRAAQHRGDYMWADPEPPRSIATGILDDETYDFVAVLRGMIDTGGWPITADEETLRRACERGCAATGIAADATGTAGLAGAYALRNSGALPTGERMAVLFTGARR